MKMNYEARQQISNYKLKDNVSYKVSYTMEDLQGALKNKEISDNKAEAISFGENVIKIDTTENSSIVNMYYPDLVKMYPDTSIEEEEGVTELEDYIVNKLSKDGVVLTYASGEKDLCIYNTDIISIA